MNNAGERAVAPLLDDALLQRFARLATAMTGMVFGDHRLPDLARAVRESVWQAGVASCAELHDLLAGAPYDAPIVRSFISHLTIGETHFFRNQPQFAALAQEILPEIIERRRSQRRLRIWSAACATGEEPYSLAILLGTLLPDYDDWDVSILATDIDQQALDQAERAVYGTWSFRQTDDAVRARYFAQQGRFFVLDGAIRRRVTFARLNLADDSYPSPANHTAEMDLILCRNVMIYFATATTQAVANRLYAALSSGGWLLVGHTEPSQEIFARYQTVNLPETVVYRRGPLPVPMGAPASGAGESGSLVGAPVMRSPRHRSIVAPLPRGNSEQTPERADVVWPGTAHDEAAPLEEIDGATRPCNATPDGMAEYEHARALAGRGQWIEAEQWIERAIERRPLLAEAHYLHALLMLEAGQRDAALTAARRCTYASSAYVAGHLLLAQLYRRSGDARRTAAALSHARKLLERQAPDAVIPDAGGATASQLLAYVDTQQALAGSDRPAQMLVSPMQKKAGS